MKPVLTQAPGRWPVWGWVLLPAAGALLTASTAPLGAWFLQLPALAVLAWAVGRLAPRRAALAGWLFGLGWLVSSLWWLYISMHDFGGLAPPLAGAAVLLLAAFLSLYLAAAMAAVARWRTGRPAFDALLYTGAWLLAELARASCFTGFPWAAPGYAHTDGLLAPLAPWLGVYGLTAVAALWGGLLGQGRALWRTTGGRGLALLALALPLAAALAPSEFTRPTGRISVSLLQPNVPQDIKFDPNRLAGNMLALREQVLAAPGQLVLTPESVLAVPQADLAPAYWQSLIQPFTRGDRAVMVGTFLGDNDQGYVNSMLGVSAATLQAGHDYSYGKRHLLPFGEFIPPGFHWFVEMMHIPLADQARGQSEAPFEVAGQRVRPLICYEDLFGEDFADSLVGPQSPTVLANASNLAWFGRWMMQDQHLQFSRMRAMEFQRPLVRSTNTGATAAIDHHGEVTARLPAWTPGRLDVVVEGREGVTPYAAWLARWHLLPLWLAGGLCALPALLTRRRRSKPPTQP